MDSTDDDPSPFEGFSKLNYKQRIFRLIKLGILTPTDASQFNKKYHLPQKIAETLIENFIGYFQIPLGIAVNFCIDKKHCIIPMAIEETSVIAAASKTAKWIGEAGEITTTTLGNHAIGQIQIAKPNNFPRLKKLLEKNKQKFIDDANATIAKNMVKRGGGVKDLVVRSIQRDDGHHMAVIHLLVNTCDAMGANIINQICEYLKTPIETLTSEKVTMCILSNLTDTKLTQARVILKNIESKLGDAIQEASLFAQQDPYRAATNNKGVLNGMDAVVIATGNDWRAVEAGVHAHAAHCGKYSSITQWKMQGKDLIGTLEAPINVGIVGGVTHLHPMANLCLKILNVKTSQELARIIAAVGLVQNLGALRALTSEGICKGHMKLHLSNLCLAAGAKPSEISQLIIALEHTHKNNEAISVSNVKGALQKIRRRD